MSSFDERGEKARRLGLIAHLIDMNNLNKAFHAQSLFSAQKLIEITPGIPIKKDYSTDLDPESSRLLDKQLEELTDRKDIYLRKKLFPPQ